MVRQNLKKLLTLDNFRRTLTYSLIVTNTFYFANIDYSILTKDNVQNIFKDLILLKFIATGIIIHLFFYKFLTFISRLVFHGLLQGKFIRQKEAIKKHKSFAKMREGYVGVEIAEIIISKVMVRLGYISKEELIERKDLYITYIKKELLNEGLADLYRWICVIIHLLFTLGFVWSYLEWWMLLIAVILIAFISLIAIGLIQMVLNVRVIEKALAKLEREFLSDLEQDIH